MAGIGYFLYQITGSIAPRCQALAAFYPVDATGGGRNSVIIGRISANRFFEIFANTAHPDRSGSCDPTPGRSGMGHDPSSPLTETMVGFGST